MKTKVTMVLVEDEQITREGLISLPIWEKLGIRIVSAQKNAKDGLKAILETKPDIVLTDIYMPGDSGLWMAEQALKQLPHLHVVIVSAHDEVRDLKHALQLGAVDYILKPIVLDELEECMRRTIARVEQEQDQTHRLQTLENRAVFDLELMKQRALESLLQPPEEGMEDLYSRVELKLNGSHLQCMVISLEGQALDKMGEDYFTGAVPAQFEIIRVPHHANRFALFFAIDNDEPEQDISAIAIKLREKINVELNRTAGIGIGLEVPEIGQLNQSYNQAREALKRRLQLGRNQIISYDEPFEAAAILPSEAVDKPNLENVLNSDSLSTLSINQYVELTKKELLAEQLNLDQCHHRIIGRIYKTQELFHLNSEEKEAFCRQTIQLISQAETIDEMTDILRGFLSEVVNSAKRNPEDQDAVDMVKEIINQRYAENISISEIARMVYLSPTYLCLIFRKREEMTINQYVTLRRIEKAKQLLILTKMPLNDIANAVGYENPGYFARRFREQTGMLPSDYRKEMTSGNK